MNAILTETGTVHLLDADGRTVCGRTLTGKPVDSAGRRVCPNCRRVEDMRSKRVERPPVATGGDEAAALRAEVGRLRDEVGRQEEVIGRLKEARDAACGRCKAHVGTIARLEKEVATLGKANADLRRLNADQGARLKGAPSAVEAALRKELAEERARCARIAGRLGATQQALVEAKAATGGAK